MADKQQMKAVPLRMPAELDDRFEAASGRTSLPKQVLMRLSMEKGLEMVERALSLSAEQIAACGKEEERPAAA